MDILLSTGLIFTEFESIDRGGAYFSVNIRLYHMFLRLWSEISLFHKLIYDAAF